MEAKTEYIEDLKIIETNLTGDVHFNDVVSFLYEVIELAVLHKCYSWLVNYQSSSFKMSTLEIYELPRKIWNMMEVLGENKYSVKRAIVNTRDKSDLLFLETTAKNTGQNLRIFENIDEAKKWIVS